MRSLGRLLGPWPMRPGAAGGFFAVFAMVWSGSRLLEGGRPLTLEGLLLILSGLLSAVVVGGCLWVAVRIAPVAVTRLPGYLAAIAATALVGAVFRVATGQLPTAPFANMGLAVGYATVRLVLFLLVTLAIMGVVTQRLEEQVRTTDAALVATREMQRGFLEADERTRAQVASVLHDRVQAGIITACLELRDAAEGAPEVTAAAIDQVIVRLERLRELDVRSAARALSPDLASQDLRTALEDLAAQYLPSMRTDVHVDSALLSDQAPEVLVLLALYRMAEQGLLNAAGHGRARECRIDVTRGHDGIDLTLRNDGAAPVPGRTGGAGSLVNDTWCAILGGRWQLDFADGTTELRAHLPLAQPAPGTRRAALA